MIVPMSTEVGMNLPVVSMETHHCDSLDAPKVQVGCTGCLLEDDGAGILPPVRSGAFTVGHILCAHPHG